MSSVATEVSPHVLNPDAVYNLKDLGRIYGLGYWALRRAQERGLKVRRIGRNKMVTGREFLRYCSGDAA